MYIYIHMYVYMYVYIHMYLNIYVFYVLRFVFTVSSVSESVVVTAAGIEHDPQRKDALHSGLSSLS